MLYTELCNGAFPLHDTAHFWGVSTVLLKKKKTLISLFSKYGSDKTHGRVTDAISCENHPVRYLTGLP